MRVAGSGASASRAARHVMLGVLLGSACADAHSSEPTSSAHPGLARAVCAHEQRCSPVGLAAYRGSSMEGCVEVQQCVHGGGATVACIQAVEAAACDARALSRALHSEACRPAPPPAAEGARCGERQRCDEGLVCASAEGLAGFCTTCQPGTVVGLGEACSERARCDGDHYCDPEGICRAPGELGEPCEQGGHCRSLDCHEGVCHQALPGDACDDARECPAGYVCREGRCEEAPDEGEACDPEQLLSLAGLNSSRGCKGFMGCVDGVCVRTACGGRAGLGEPCGAVTLCPDGAACDALTGRCRLMPAVGEPCDVEDYWRLGFACREGYCDADSGRCLAHHADGAPCETSRQCNGACDAGRCGPSPLSGFDRAGACAPPDGA